MNSMVGAPTFGQQVGFNPKLATRHGKMPGDIRPRGYKFGQVQQFTPEQMQQFGSLFGHVGPDSYLSKLAGGDQETFNQIEAPAMRQFQDVLGGIANRFSGSGMGGRRSSGFQNATTSAASNFAQELQAQRNELRRQALNELMQYSQMLFGQRPQERFLAQKGQKKTSGLSGLLGAGIGGLGGFFAGGPAGALTGASFGSQIGQGLF